VEGGLAHIFYKVIIEWSDIPEIGFSATQNYKSIVFVVNS